ncbi:MAG: DoxX family protein [Chloroflexota bacterium]|nr:DoxX family protein [Chloroflexota bacterium]
MFRIGVFLLQFLVAVTFIIIPVSRMFGAATLRQVLLLAVPLWLIWVANVIELSGAVLLLLGLRLNFLAAVGALLIAASMVGATLAHIRAGNLFAEVPWTLVFLGLCLIIVLLQWPAVQAVLKRL